MNKKPFPDCAKDCGCIEYFGVCECESICPEKFDKNGNPLECGRRVCSYCKIDLGPAPGLEPGELTHGACPECYAKIMKELDKKIGN